MKAEIFQIVANNFQKEILEEENPVLLLCSDYGSELPDLLATLTHIKQLTEGALKVALLAETFLKLFQESYNVIGTPTFLLFSKGREKGRLLGQTDSNTLTQWIRGLHVLH